jgi:hypothetical protein
MTASFLMFEPSAWLSIAFSAAYVVCGAVVLVAGVVTCCLAMQIATPDRDATSARGAAPV